MHFPDDRLRPPLSLMRESRECIFHSGKLIREPGVRQVQQVLLGVRFFSFFLFFFSRATRENLHTRVIGDMCDCGNCIHLMVVTQKLLLTELTRVCVFASSDRAALFFFPPWSRC